MGPYIATKDLGWNKYYDNVYPVKHPDRIHLAAFESRNTVNWVVYLVDSEHQVYTHHLRNFTRSSRAPTYPWEFLTASEGRYEAVFEESVNKGAWYFILNEEVKVKHCYRTYRGLPPYYLVCLNMRPFADRKAYLILSRHSDDQGHFIPKGGVITTLPHREKYAATIEYFRAGSPARPSKIESVGWVFWISITGALTSTGYSLNFSVPGAEEAGESGLKDLVLESIHVKNRIGGPILNYDVLRHVIDEINRQFKSSVREFTLVYATTLALGTQHGDHEQYYLSLRDPQFHEICGDILIEETQPTSLTRTKSSAMIYARAKSSAMVYARIARVDTRWIASCEGVFTNGGVSVDIYDMNSTHSPKYPSCAIKPLSRADQLILEDPVDKVLFPSSRYHCSC